VRTASLLNKYVTLVAGLVLLASLVVWWQSRRELNEVRRELQAVTEANLFLKKTLGDMTIAITRKDKEIDRLEHAACIRRSGAPASRSDCPPAGRCQWRSRCSVATRAAYIEPTESRDRGR
jgi:hypothetical protein